MRVVAAPDHLHGDRRGVALRRVPARFFGVFMSVNPVFAALTGLAVLGQSPGLAGWLAIAAIVTANAVIVSAAGRHVAACGCGERGGRSAAAEADPEPEPAA